MYNDPFGTAPTTADEDDFDIDLPEEDSGFCIPEGPYVVPFHQPASAAA